MKEMRREPTGPGVVLREIIDETEGLTQEKLAHDMGVTFKAVNQLVNGRTALTAPMALRLARRFDMAPQFWLNMQNAVDLYRARKTIDKRAAAS